MTERAGGEQRIMRSTTQAVRSYPRIGPAGTPLLEQFVSCTAVVRPPSGGLEDSRNASRDELSLTVAAAAARNAASILVDDTGVSVTDVVDGRSYIAIPLTVAPFEIEAVETVVGTAGTLRVILAEPLPVALAAGVEIVGWQVSLPLTADETRNIGSGTVSWTGTTAGGAVYTWVTPFLVVDRVVSWTLTPTRLTQAYPVIATILSDRDDDGAELIEAAWNHRVLPRLAARGILGEQIVSPEAVEPLHAQACLLQIVEPDPTYSTEYVARIQAAFDSRIEELVGRSDWWTTPPNSEDIPARALEQQPTRIVRVTR